MRKRHWKDRKNRPCPDCGKMLTYSRKDSFDRAVGNNSVCKSCAMSDRKLTMETIEKMKKPKTQQHKKKISKRLLTFSTYHKSTTMVNIEVQIYTGNHFCPNCASSWL